MIVPTLCVGMPLVTLCVTRWDAERPGLHSHAERGNDLSICHCFVGFGLFGHQLLPTLQHQARAALLAAADFQFEPVQVDDRRHN